MSDYGPQVKLARLYEKKSKTGNQYFIGRLGMAKVAVLKSKEVAEDGSPMWDVLLQEASSEQRRKPEAREEAQPEATAPAAAAAPYSAKRLPDDSIPF
jgi:hypothetical protein